MENERFPTDLFEVDGYHRKLPECVAGRVVLEAYPVKKGYNATPVDNFRGFIAMGEPKSYQEFFELFGWWAIEKFDVRRADYGWPNEGDDFFQYLHWALHKNDPSGDEKTDLYNQRHYMPSGAVARCEGFFDSEGHPCDKKNDLVVVIRFIKGLTLEEFDGLYKGYREAQGKEDILMDRAEFERRLYAVRSDFQSLYDRAIVDHGSMSDIQMMALMEASRWLNTAFSLISVPKPNPKR